MSHTPLPVAKWTKSSLIKCLEGYYTDSFQKLINSNKPVYEKKWRANLMLQTFLSIYEPIMEYGVTVKKQ